MSVGSVNYSNNAVSFGKRPNFHMSDNAKHNAAVIATGIATGAALTAGVVYRKNIGSMLVKGSSKFGEALSGLGKKIANFCKSKTGKLKGLPAPQTDTNVKIENMQAAVEKIKIKQGFKGFMNKLGKGIKKGFKAIGEFFTKLWGKIRNFFSKSSKTNLPAQVSK